MKITSIAGVIATVVLAAALVPASSAQAVNDSALNNVEVITIVAKRPAPTVASACVHEVFNQTSATANTQERNANGQTSTISKTDMISMRQAIRHCIEQAAVTAQTQS